MPYQNCLQILVVDDDAFIRESLTDFLKKLGHVVYDCQSGEEAFDVIKKKEFDIVLLDIKMPGIDGFEVLLKLQEIQPALSIIMISGHGTMDMTIQALRDGASDFLKKPIKFHELEAALERSIRLTRLRLEKKRLEATIGAIQYNLSMYKIEDLIIGESKATIDLRKQIQFAARSAFQSVVITGETGTGKEVVARVLHKMMHTPSDPFIALNCAAIPEHLIESELFGHMRGAFTGAVADRLGAFELAHGGTLFLDEISDLSAMTQAKLLRVLEERSIRPIGSNREKKVNVSVVAASNQDLSKLMEEGKFRSDLYFRLNLFCIEILPLRDRPEDILPLAIHFISDRCKIKGHFKCTLSPEAQKHLLEYHFPGNVRELRNIIERAVMLSEDCYISKEHLMILPKNIKTKSDGFSADKGMNRRQENNCQQDEAQITLNTLQQVKWNRRKAAEKLCISYETLRWRIKKYSLEE